MTDPEKAMDLWRENSPPPVTAGQREKAIEAVGGVLAAEWGRSDANPFSDFRDLAERITETVERVMAEGDEAKHRVDEYGARLYPLEAIDVRPAEVSEAPTAAREGGVALIAAERARQITEEGWTPERDDQYIDGDLTAAAMSYVFATRQRDLRERLGGER